MKHYQRPQQTNTSTVACFRQGVKLDTKGDVFQIHSDAGVMFSSFRIAATWIEAAGDGSLALSEDDKDDID